MNFFTSLERKEYLRGLRDIIFEGKKRNLL